MQHRLRAWFIGSVLVLAASIAQAQTPAERGWYGGLSAGQSRIDFGSNFPLVAGTTSVVAKDDEDTAYTLFGGYRFNRHLALEVGYTDFGEFSIRRNVTAPAAGSVTTRVKSNGVHVDVLGILPAGERLEVFGRLGVIRTATTTDHSTTGGVVLIAPAHDKDYNVSPRIGAGAHLRLTRELGLRLEYNRQDIDFRIFSESASIDLVSLGLVFRF